MKVKELIEKLKKHDPEMTVGVRASSHEYNVLPANLRVVPAKPDSDHPDFSDFLVTAWDKNGVDGAPGTVKVLLLHHDI